MYSISWGARHSTTPLTRSPACQGQRHLNQPQISIHNGPDSSRAPIRYLDDWGPEQLTAPQRRDLMEVIDERYGRKATIVTSQLPIDTWHDMIGDPTFADAILDRLVHNAHKFALDGPSMRKRSSQTQSPDAG
ncbi:ATP-binding protein [Marivita cryptomonadis]|uniref:ATP-binding protein n=1 Tax=Marivita cryptomonadis TaxID=505252 RepID=UPI003CC81641